MSGTSIWGAGATDPADDLTESILRFIRTGVLASADDAGTVSPTEAAAGIAAVIPGEYLRTALAIALPALITDLFGPDADPAPEAEALPHMLN